MIPDEEGPNTQKIENLDLTTLCMYLIDHPTANVRIAAFSLIISSSSSNTPLPSNVLAYLQECIPCFHQETNPRTRNEFIALIKPLCLRLVNAAKAFSRLSAADGQRYRNFAGAHVNLMPHIKLARWYQRYLLQELRPTASYQSHITALKILPLIFGSNTLTELISSNRQHPSPTEQRENKPGEGNTLDHVRPLLDLLVDPYDDVRQSASSVLGLLIPSTFFDGWMYRSNWSVDVYIRTNKLSQTKLIESTETAVSRAEEHVSRSGRADQADGAGRLYDVYYRFSRIPCCPDTIQQKSPFDDILSRLEQTLKVVGNGLPHTITSTSLQGHLIALR